MKKINIENKLGLFSDFWNPKIIGELNEQHVKLVKLKGEFIWHKHDNEDELFLVLKGNLKIEFRAKTVELTENEMFIIPRGVEHKPIAEKEVSVLLFEPKDTLNTGKQRANLTQDKLDWI
ncbi:MAG: cupin domain-containing protein [Flavobacteriales bacterium]|nr:cupin domain-containing protein [Flavobacteriales bacterium]